MARRKHPVELEMEAFMEPRGIGSPAFLKMVRANEAWAKDSVGWQKAFEAEYLAHHTDKDTDMVTKPCRAALQAIPKYTPASVRKKNVDEHSRHR